MTSRFLSGNSTDLSALQDGSFALNVASAMVADLAPGLPVRVGLDHSLESGQITVADCAFTPSTNPATGDLDLAGHNITNVGTISGATNSRTADNIVSSAGNGVAGNLPTWTGTSKVLVPLSVLNDDIKSCLKLTGAPWLATLTWRTTKSRTAGP